MWLMQDTGFPRDGCRFEWFAGSRVIASEFALGPEGRQKLLRELTLRLHMPEGGDPVLYTEPSTTR